MQKSKIENRKKPNFNINNNQNTKKLKVKFEKIFEIERKSIFFINLILILIISIFYFFQIEIQYFFYLNLIITFFLSYLFFYHSKKLSKTLILTNLFIFFYFLYGEFISFLYQGLGTNSFLYIGIYNVALALVFYKLSNFGENISLKPYKFNFKISIFIILIGIFTGFIFFLLKEIVPTVFLEVFAQNSSYQLILVLIFIAFSIAISEQLIFTAFLFNSYRKFTNKFDATIQTSSIFVIFHFIKFSFIINYYSQIFAKMYLFYIFAYFLFLFLFMSFSIFLYSFKSKKFQGNFWYSVLFHFIVDLIIFTLYLL